MNYIAKAIHSALRDAIKYQNNAAAYSLTARQIAASPYYVDDRDRAAEWQKVSANQYKWARHYRDKAIELAAEYNRAKAALITIEGEYCEKYMGGYRRLYTKSKSVAIARIAARKATEATIAEKGG